MAFAFDWAALRRDLHHLSETAITPEQVRDYVWSLDQLEARLYERQSELERAAYSDPRAADARQALSIFELEIKPEATLLIDRCVATIRPHFDALPESWKPCLRPFVFRSLDHEDVTHLLAEVSARSTEFQAIAGAVSYSYDDGTSDDPLNFRGSPEGAVRERAHRAMLRSEARVQGEYVALFTDLHGLRTQAAQRGGHANALEMLWQSEYLAERDYGPSDVRRVRELVKTYVCPLLREIRAYRARRLNLPTLAPWDAATGLGGQPLRLTLSDVPAALDGLSGVFEGLSSRLGSAFRQHRAAGMYAVAGVDEPYRPGYGNFLPISGLSWMTCWYVGTPESLFTVIHEAGHTLHRSLIGPDTLFRQHFPAMEYSELVPQLLEVLSLPHLTPFCGDEHSTTVQLLLLERALGVMVYRARMDEFQEEVYRRTDLDGVNLDDLYLRLLDEYPDGVDHSSLGGLQGQEWVNWQTFMRPFYGIEYVLAWYAALQWFGEIPPQGLDVVVSRHQDAPTSVMFRDLGVSLCPDDGEFREWFALLGKHVAALTAG